MALVGVCHGLIGLRARLGWRGVGAWQRFVSSARVDVDRRSGRWRQAVLRVGQAQAQAVPAGIRQLAPQRTYDPGPVGAFASAGDQHHHAVGLGRIGGTPQGQEGFIPGLQHLLFLAG
ncbi:hypothetical protein D9M68_852630 [compost metagenome]